MSIHDIEIPFVPMSDIQIVTSSFYNQYNTVDTIPVDIEFIVENDLGIEIIPIPGLRAGFGIDGFISNTFSSITVDLDLLEKYYNRYRFTIAHEIAHKILHKQIYQELGFDSIEDWKNAITAFDPKNYSRMERQADTFAGLLLMPTHHLKEQFKLAIDKLIDQGFDIRENTDLMLKYISTALSKQFDASPSAIQTRISQENLMQQYCT